MTAHARELASLTLLRGPHVEREQGMCVMEAAAWVAGEAHSDHPRCASRVLGNFLRAWNDALDDEDRQMLVPLIPRLVGTAGSDDDELKRSWMALDWYCRVSTPTWLRLAGLTAEAEAIEATAPIVEPASARAAQVVLSRAREAASATYAATYAAARAAARAAAGDAAGAAAGDAAWAAAGDAARGAAGAAAGATTRDAAEAAIRAAAGAGLRPTVEILQRSAIGLVDRMIAITTREAAS